MNDTLFIQQCCKLQYQLYNTCIPFIGLLVSTVTDCFQCLWTDCLTNIMYL